MVDAPGRGGRLLIHGARREAWQQWRTEHGADYYAQATGPQGGRLAPQSERARTAALGLVEGAEADGEHVTVPDLRTAVDALTEDGWSVE